MRYVPKIECKALFEEAEKELRGCKDYNDSNRVRQILRELYFGCCAYCGSRVEQGAFYQIDHFYPKSNVAYRKYAKTFENLHYACQRCNSLKSKHEPNDLMSPNCYLKNNVWGNTKSKKIEQEMFYLGYLVKSKNTRGTVDRGLSTIKLFNLNNEYCANSRSDRAALVEERIRVFERAYEIMALIYELVAHYKPPLNKSIDSAISVFLEMISYQSQFSVMVAHNFGASFLKLLEVYFQKRYRRVRNISTKKGMVIRPQVFK